MVAMYLQIKYKFRLRILIIHINVGYVSPYYISIAATYPHNQGWEAGAGRSRVFLAPWNRSRSRLKKNEEPEPEPEPLGKKSQEPEPEPEPEPVKISRLLSPARR